MREQKVGGCMATAPRLRRTELQTRGPLRASSPAVAAKEVPAPKPSIKMAGVQKMESRRRKVFVASECGGKRHAAIPRWGEEVTSWWACCTVSENDGSETPSTSQSRCKAVGAGKRGVHLPGCECGSIPRLYGARSECDSPWGQRRHRGQDRRYPHVGYKQ